MTPRTGRPKSDNPKNVKLTIRITEDEDKTLTDYSTNCKMTKTDVIRKGIHELLDK